MTLVTGPLSTVTTVASAVTQVEISIDTPRTTGTGLMTAERKKVAVTGGNFSSPIAPGNAAITLIIAGRESVLIPILVDDVATQTLAEVVDAARLATGETQESLAQFVQQVLGAADDVATAKSAALAEIDGEVQRAIDESAQTTIDTVVIPAIEGARDEALNEADLAIAAAKDANSVSRVAALEAMAGLSPESPVDGQTANLIGQSETLTRKALDDGYTKRGEVVHNVVDYGARPNSYLDDSAAIQAAINAGGTTYFPPGTYIAKGLTPPLTGMRLQGAKRGGTGSSRLRTVDGVLFDTDGAHVHSAHMSNMTFDSFREGAKSGGAILSGSWNQSTFHFCSFTQYNDSSPAFEITGWIDNLMTECSITHTTTATVPTFRAISSSGDLAQSVFQSCRFTNSGLYSVHLEGTQGSIPINFAFRDVNFEIPVGGAIRLLSCRNILIDNCGLWDFWDEGAKRHQISIGRSTNAGAESRNITIRNLIRDASLPPLTEIYDIFVYPDTSRDVSVIDCRHQLNESFKVSMGNAVGTLSGGGMTIFNARRCTRLTGGWSTYTPELLGDGTTLGNGSITGSWTRVGNTVNFQAYIILGSTSTVGSRLRLSLPIPALTTRSYSALSGIGIQTDMPLRKLEGIITSDRNSVTMYSPINGELSALTSTFPVTWGAQNAIEIRGAYEVEA